VTKTVLEELVVSNLGLIPEASLSPSKGLTVITGETGAGKTVMLGALRLLIGEPAAKGLIGPCGDEADVSARFVDGTDHVARRVVTPGRSKAYLDGAISTASALRETIGPRVSIVGQHDQHTITSSEGVRRLVDVSLTSKERSNLDSYGKAWDAYEMVRSEADLLGSDQRHLARELETIRFQIAEITDAGFAIGDDELLRARAGKLRNAEELATAIDTILDRLGDGGAGGHLENAVRAVDSAAGLDNALEEISDRIGELNQALSDINSEVIRYAADLRVDPEALEETEQRVSLLSSLKRKYGDSLEAVLAFHKGATARELELGALLASADDIAERLDAASRSLDTAGEALRSTRNTAAGRIAEAAHGHLTDLGFRDPKIEISVVSAAPTRSGADTATVLFASDASMQPGPVSTIASGGELSRLVLALTLASGGADTDVVAFDEIDAGVGGETALAMGQKLASLAATRQVLCVTHLPQVAAFADKHYVVTRTGATASISETVDAQRTEELSRMLAGLSSSEKGQEHAEELLALASEKRRP
jgi:DNA repair protein RecN (Recombination protein N)